MSLPKKEEEGSQHQDLGQGLVEGQLQRAGSLPVARKPPPSNRRPHSVGPADLAPGGASKLQSRPPLEKWRSFLMMKAGPKQWLQRRSQSLMPRQHQGKPSGVTPWRAATGTWPAPTTPWWLFLSVLHSSPSVFFWSLMSIWTRPVPPSARLRLLYRSISKVCGPTVRESSDLDLHKPRAASPIIDQRTITQRFII